MPRRHNFPTIDPVVVLPGAKFLKNSADYRGKGVYDVVEHIEEVTDSTGTHQRVHYRNSETGRRGDMAMEDFCLGVQHLLPPPEPPTQEPELVQAPVLEEADGPITIDMLLAEVRAVRAGQAEILSCLKRLFPSLQLPIPGM